MRKFLFAICSLLLVAGGATAFDGGYENPPTISSCVLSDDYTMEAASPVSLADQVEKENPVVFIYQSFDKAAPGPDIGARYNASPETESVNPEACLTFDRWRASTQKDVIKPFSSTCFYYAEATTAYFDPKNTIAAPQEPDEAQPFHQGRDGCSC